jgi:hypothetical protein
MRWRRPTGTDSPQLPDSPAGFLESGEGPSRAWPVRAPYHLGKNDLARFVRSYSAHIHRQKVDRVANLQRSPMRQASGDASEVESRVLCAINFKA